MKKRIILAAVLSVVLCAGMMTACGNNTSDNTEETKDPTKLSSSVSVAAYEGAGTDVLKNIDGDYNVKGYDKIEDVEKKIENGDYDVAVLPTTSAASMYGKTGRDLIEISPASSNGIFVLANNYYPGSTKLSALSGKTIYVAGEDSTATRVFQYLMNQAGLSTGSYTLKVLNSYGEIKKALDDYGNIAVVAQPYAKSIMKGNSNVNKAYDLNEKWKEETNTDIPSDVVIANRSFSEKRNDDLKVFINDYQEAVDKTKSKAKLVFYGTTNRGTSLLKEFNDTMYSYNSGIFDGKSIKNSMYYQEQ
ncbi:MAG: MqnA/MqnD/SBP family protein [Eubacteriaceae bacterium]|nr:MqnA/MqnD/SBP family protein [Eubacteriaceae bacterium]